MGQCVVPVLGMEKICTPILPALWDLSRLSLGVGEGRWKDGLLLAFKPCLVLEVLFINQPLSKTLIYSMDKKQDYTG